MSLSSRSNYIAVILNLQRDKINRVMDYKKRIQDVKYKLSGLMIFRPHLLSNTREETVLTYDFKFIHKIYK